MAEKRHAHATGERSCPWCGKRLREDQEQLCDLCEAAYWLSELEFDLAVREVETAAREEGRGT